MVEKMPLGRVFIFCGIFLGVVLAGILIAPFFISENFIRQKTTQIVENALGDSCQIGTVSFHWPNRVNVSHLTVQRQEQGGGAPIQAEDLQGTVNLFPLFRKEVSLAKISVRYINYENRFLVEKLVTKKFSFKNGIISTDAQFMLNDGASTLKGTVDFHTPRPAFDFLFTGKDIHITQDMPVFQVFTENRGELGGSLSLSGTISGRGMGSDSIKKKLVADVKLMLREGYIRGNRLVSSILEIIGAKDSYSFQSAEAEIQIRDGKIYASQMDIKGSAMNLRAAGTAEFEGTIAFDAVVQFDKAYLSKGIEKIAGLVLKDNELPLEISGTVKDPVISVKLPKDNLDHLIKGLVNEFLSTSKGSRKREKKSGGK
jgi:uncharacterized protein involved in outer membrane biogenesis